MVFVAGAIMLMNRSAGLQENKQEDQQSAAQSSIEKGPLMY